MCAFLIVATGVENKIARLFRMFLLSTALNSTKSKGTAICAGTLHRFRDIFFTFVNNPG
jgi:hypothetical protein